MLILVDQDAVLADFDHGFQTRWAATHPTAPQPVIAERTEFYIEEGFPVIWRPHINEVMRQPGFFRDLRPIPGALDGINELADLGHDVRICTAPLADHPDCLAEKTAWTLEHLGSTWAKRMIFTRDKTLVTGDALIDDKPTAAHGLIRPTWTHIFYTSAYNRHLPGPRMTWATAVETICDVQMDRTFAGTLLTRAA